MREWQYWTRNKLSILAGYLPAFNERFSSSATLAEREAGASHRHHDLMCAAAGHHARPGADAQTRCLVLLRPLPEPDC